MTARRARAREFDARSLALLFAFGSCGGEATGPTSVGSPGKHAGHTPGDPAPAWFLEAAAAAGLDFRHVSGPERRFDFPEIMGGGVALFDHDGDGDLDAYFVQAGDVRSAGDERPTNRLYSNRGDGTFEDMTERSGTGDRGYGMGVACGDFDADGDQDLYVTNVGPNVLYENQGDGTFRDVTARSGTGDPGWGTSCAFVDYDADGRLDLFVVNYLRWSVALESPCFSRENRRDYCSPNNYDARARDTLYRNLGDGRFEDVSEAVGLGRDFGNGLGVACGDFDLDGRVDFYVANDMNPNQLWLQREAGVFENASLLHGVALSGSGFAESGMGVQAVDLGGDGDLDLFLSHLRNQSNTLYENRGGTFYDMTARYGLASSSMHATGFGLGFADFDLDGDLDLFVANGPVANEEPLEDPTNPYGQSNQLFEQTSALRFAERLPKGGTDPVLVATSRGAAFGDVDADGDIDVLIANIDGPPHLLLNRAGGERAWLALDVRDERGTLAIGALVRVRVGERTQWRRVDPAYSYCSSNEPSVHFGLGGAVEAAGAAVLVRWPDGAETDFGAREARRRHTLVRPAD